MVIKIIKALIVLQKMKVKILEKWLMNARMLLHKFISKHQKICPHKGDKEKIFEQVELPVVDFHGPLERAILRGWICKDCEAFIPSRVWNFINPYLSRIESYCELCDGNVRSVKSYYVCKACGHYQDRIGGI
jgi:hypothetical protein